MHDPHDRPSSVQIVRRYHERTKHRRTGYAAGPEALDWDAQPAPFRRFVGAPEVALARTENQAVWRCLERAFSSGCDLREPTVASLGSLGALLHLSFGITAWKTMGPDRWPVRANPSSGNLHPVEAYLVVERFPGLDPGVYHYRPEDHVLERRAMFGEASQGRGGVGRPFLGVGLTAIMWREAWKYGERGFRYCQLDTGHAIGALQWASAALGWRLSEQREVGTESLGHALGLDRMDDFPVRRYAETEREEPEVLLSLDCEGLQPASFDACALRQAVTHSSWHGVASTIDPRPLYRWPVVEEVAEATRTPDGLDRPRRAAVRGGSGAGQGERECLRSMADVILGRRSAQRFDSRSWLDAAQLFGLLESVLPDTLEASGVLARTHSIDLVLFVHRVAQIDPGVYLLTRPVQGTTPLAAHLASHFDLARLVEAPPALDIRRVASVDSRVLARFAREVHCRQDIAAQACFVAAMVAEFDANIEDDPASYRELHREAGWLGHALYLEAEARGLRGTGIGCFLDDELHNLLKLSDASFQSLYHFAVGKAVDDARIDTSPTHPPFSFPTCPQGPSPRPFP